jgi:methanogenic corrinoid protein MtbC1
VAAPPGEQHGLPVDMAAAALRQDGWTVELLGRDMPADALHDFVVAAAPDLVVLSVTTPANAPVADDISRDLSAAGHDVLVGEAGRTLVDLIQAAQAVGAEQRRLMPPRPVQ